MDKLPLISQLIGPLTDLLMLLTNVLHSYGLAIIVFTILVRGVLAPLNLRQLHSAKKMAALGPRIKQIQQQYKGDRDALTKAQMALYKEEGVNPAAGCLPLLIQMPVLYALFFVFNHLSQTHNRGATAIYHHTFLWFHLDKPDSLFGHFLLGPHSFWGPLPILAALTQWVQSRMMMQPVSDPQQRTTQQIMQFMPLFILVFAVNYPAGLALYWVTSTCFSIVLQYFITGWGQLFSSPFKLPEAPPPQPRTSPPPPAPRTPPSSPRTPRPSPRSDGPGPETTPSAPSAPSRASPLTSLFRRGPTQADDGPAPARPDESAVRLGKMQRAAMRPNPKARTRSSRGAKR